MLERASLLCLALWLADSAVAQQNDLSVGISGNYAPVAGAGLGASMDFRHRMNAHLDLGARFSGSFFTGLGQSAAFGEQRIFHTPIYGFLGAGLVYRTRPDGLGLRAGLMPGLACVPFIDPMMQQRYGVTSAAVVSVDYHFNDRIALALESMVYLAPGSATGAGRPRQMPTLRLKIRAGES